jgi:hypothetical protein
MIKIQFYFIALVPGETTKGGNKHEQKIITKTKPTSRQNPTESAAGQTSTAPAAG